MDQKSDKNTFFSPKRIFEFNGKKIDLTEPRVMGILNVTPDSFYDGKKRGKGDKETRGKGEEGNRGNEKWETGTANCEQGTANRIKKADELIKEGAYIIDIGAVSTRPGAKEVGFEEEKLRLIPVLKEVRKNYPTIIISIDTYRAEIARIAAGEGADMINDISGGTMDPDMLSAIVHLHIPYVIMHIQGTPANMQVNPFYDDVVKDVFDFVMQQAGKLENSGHSQIIIDPGFGFGKSLQHNFELLDKLNVFSDSGYPVLAGLSRKSMINRVLNIKPDEALNGTTVLNTIALLKGASILRVHDVKEAVEAIRLVNFANFVPSK